MGLVGLLVKGQETMNDWAVMTLICGQDISLLDENIYIYKKRFKESDLWARHLTAGQKKDSKNHSTDLWARHLTVGQKKDSENHSTDLWARHPTAGPKNKQQNTKTKTF